MDFETVLPLKTVSDIIKEVKESNEPTHHQNSSYNETKTDNNAAHTH